MNAQIQYRRGTDPKTEDERVAMSKEAFKRAFLDNLFYVQGKIPALATRHDYYMALAYTVRDRMLQRWISTAETYTTPRLAHGRLPVGRVPDGPAPGQQPAESRHLRRGAPGGRASLASTSTSCWPARTSPASATAAWAAWRPASSTRWRRWRSPRSATASATSSASSNRRSSTAGRSRSTDKWLRFGNAWEMPRPEWAVEVKLGGHTETLHRSRGPARACAGCRIAIVIGVPYDTPILGYRVNTANTLRLWRAEAPESFDFSAFNRGDYYGAVNQKVVSENLTKVLYPNDEAMQGKELRLEQQYFFVCCSLQDMLRILQRPADSADPLPREVRRPAERHPSRRSPSPS